MAIVSSLVFAATLGIAPAEPDISRLIRAYQTLPAPAVAIAIDQEPDSRGFISYNRKDGWVSVAHQRGLAEALNVAIAQEDRKAIKRTMIAVEKTFARMKHNGSWETFVEDGTRANPGGIAQANMSWLAEIVPALMRLQAWKSTYAPQVDALRDAIQRAGQYAFLRANLLHTRTVVPSNWALQDAKGFLYLGEFLGKYKYVQEGNLFLQEALSRQTELGIFPEDNGADTNYQAVSLRHLAAIIHLNRSVEAKQAFRAGADWLLDRFQEDGKLNVVGNSRTGIGELNRDGSEKLGNQPVEILFALVLVTDLWPTSRATETAAKFVSLAFDEAGHAQTRDHYIVAAP